MKFRDNQAIYIQIADHFCESILLKKWKAGDRIPSVREMAVSLEVNPNTVMRTFTYLQEQGIIYNKRGIGYFVADDGLEQVQGLKKDAFVSQELPRLFKAMQLLGISLKELGAYLDDFQRSQNTQA